MIGSTNGISFGGIASGLDTEGIIAKLVAIDKSSVARLTQQKARLLQKADLYGSFKSAISGIAQAANALNATDAFQSVGIAVSDPAVMSVVATTGTQPGSYDFKISKLAQAQKISSTAQASTTAALGQTGQFIVNGKVVTVDATDSMQTIAAKVNALNIGVSAGVVNGGTGQAFLTFTAAQTGLVNKPELSDLTGTTLASLGILAGAETVRQTIPNGANSFSLSSNTTAFASLTGATGLGPQTIQINGVNVALDLSTDGLQGVADKINSAATGATASVVTTVDKGVTKYSLQIKGAGSTPTFTDAGNTLSSLGILQQGAGHELIAAQDAQFTVDNVALTSAGDITLTHLDQITTGSISAPHITLHTRNGIGTGTDYLSPVQMLTTTTATLDVTNQSGDVFIANHGPVSVSLITQGDIHLTNDARVTVRQLNADGGKQDASAPSLGGSIYLSTSSPSRLRRGAPGSR